MSEINLPWRIHHGDVGTVVMDAKDNVVLLDAHMSGIIEAIEALDAIANSGMDARQCMLTARNALKSI